MARSVVLVVCAGLLLTTGCVSVQLGGWGRGELVEKTIYGEDGPKIALLDVDGVISSASERGPLGLGERESIVSRVRAQLDRADKAEVRALILRINSPGGTVTASEIIRSEILHFKEQTGIPIVAQLMGVATSGAYYVAMASDAVYAHPTSVTGSIGVILMGVNVAGLMGKLGIENETLVSGPFKDAGSPLRPMTGSERAHLQGVIDDLHGRFVTVVAEGRPQLPRTDVEALADGRVYSATQALELGLIDGIASLPDTVEEARRRAGLERARVVVFHRPREWRENLYSAPPFGIDFGALLPPVRPPAFLYLWWPGAVR